MPNAIFHLPGEEYFVSSLLQSSLDRVGIISEESCSWSLGSWRLEVWKKKRPPWFEIRSWANESQKGSYLMDHLENCLKTERFYAKEFFENKLKMTTVILKRCTVEKLGASLRTAQIRIHTVAASTTRKCANGSQASLAPTENERLVF